MRFSHGCEIHPEFNAVPFALTQFLSHNARPGYGYYYPSHGIILPWIRSIYWRTRVTFSILSSDNSHFFFYFLKSIEIRFNFIFIGTHLRCALSTANLFHHVVDILWFDKSWSSFKRVRLIFTNRIFFRVNKYF